MDESERVPKGQVSHLLPQGRPTRIEDPFALVGSSEPFKTMEKELRQAAAWDEGAVLLVGERGSGKEMAARALHRWSPRRDKAFLPVLAPALSDDLLADELFGHARDSFTGAAQAREGRFAAVEGGVIFLDEIGDLSLRAQAALLRILDAGEFRIFSLAKEVRGEFV